MGSESCPGISLSVFSPVLHLLLFFRKAQLHKGSRWGPKRMLGDLHAHPLGVKLCFSVDDASELCLCGCSLRTKLMLHPRPTPASRQVCQALPRLLAGKKQLSSLPMICGAQLSHGPPKSKGVYQAKSQEPSWRNATPLLKLCQWACGPRDSLNPSPSLCGRNPCTPVSTLKGATSPTQESYPQ
jgi:hypothetical protein